MGAIVQGSKKASSYSKLKRTVEESKFDAAIGLYNNHFEVMVFMMRRFLSECFVARGLTEEKMVDYIYVGMGSQSICQHLDKMYQYVNELDKTGLKALKKFQGKILQVIENRNTIIHGIHMKVKTGSVSINMKKTRRSKPDAQLKHTTDDIQKNSNYVAELTGHLTALEFRVKKGISLSGILEEFNEKPVPEIGQSLLPKT